MLLSSSEPEKPFLLSVDASFLNTLTDEDVEQTEELANQIAMRAVSHASLERV